jgi:hypothetical protein
MHTQQQLALKTLTKQLNPAGVGQELGEYTDPCSAKLAPAAAAVTGAAVEEDRQQQQQQQQQQQIGKMKTAIKMRCWSPRICATRSCGILLHAA